MVRRRAAVVGDRPVEVAAFSARGNVGIGIEGDFGRYKPDLMAPGTFVISARSSEWDERAYYNPTSHIGDVLDVVILTNRAFTNLISIPNNAVAFTIQLARNQKSPVPFPGLPIFVRQAAPPGPGDPVATNIFSVPGAQIGALTPVGTTWYYAVANLTTQNVNLAIITDIVVTNDQGNYFEVLSNLNNSLSGGAPHYYRYESGTSMSAADVSGTLALMQEFFERRMTPPVTNSPALYKALLINGARALPSPYDFQVQKNTANFQGWGLLNLPNSLPVSITNGVTHAGPSSMQIFDQSPTNALARQQRACKQRIVQKTVRDGTNGQQIRAHDCLGRSQRQRVGQFAIAAGNHQGVILHRAVGVGRDGVDVGVPGEHGHRVIAPQRRYQIHVLHVVDRVHVRRRVGVPR